MTKKPARTLAALRQLACLGLPGKTILPEAIELLRALAGFEVEGAFYLDGRYQLIDAHVPSDVPLSVLRDYAENFHNRTDGDGVTGLTTQQAMESNCKTIHWKRFIDRRTLIETVFWNRIMQPVDMGWGVQFPLRGDAGRPPHVHIVLSRPFSLPDFSPKEIRLLELAHPWMRHAMAGGGNTARGAGEPALPTGQSGTLILDGAGRIQSASPGALPLLHQAAGVALAGDALGRSVRGDAEPLLRRLAQAVGAAVHGKAGPVPAAIVRNDHGIFHLRAYALETFAAGTPQHVSLHIERHAPTSLRLFRSPRFLALSAREREVCLMILGGRSSTETARHLGIKPSSVIQHTKSLYLRLGINSQKGLLPALLDSQSS